MDDELKAIPIGSWEVLEEGRDAVILTFGTTIQMALHAAEQLREQGVQVEVVNARFIKPLDGDMLESIFGRNVPVLTIEEAVLQGGFGSAVLEYAQDNGHTGAVIDRMGIPDLFVEHGDVAELMDEIDLNSDEVVKKIKSRVKQHSQQERSNAL